MGAAQEPAVVRDLTEEQFRTAWEIVRATYISDVTEARMGEIAAVSILKSADRLPLPFDATKPAPVSEVLSLAAAVQQETRSSEPLLRRAMKDILKSLEGANELETRAQVFGSPPTMGGIGVVATVKQGAVAVVGLPRYSPSRRAGMVVGDVILKVDGIPTDAGALAAVMTQFKGQPGSTTVVTVSRAGVEAPFDLEIRREIIKATAVESATSGHVTLLSLTGLQDVAAAGLTSVIVSAKSAPAETRGYILDLRNNPGGLLDQAVRVSDIFLEGGEVVTQRGRRDATRYNARPGDLIDGRPLVVLTNRATGAGAEIIAAALRDHRRAVLVGEKTVGLGSVRTAVPLGGDDVLIVVTSRSYAPSGVTFDKVGVEPDVFVDDLAKGSTIYVDDKFTPRKGFDKAMLMTASRELSDVSADLAAFNAPQDDAVLAYAIRLLRRGPTGP